MKEVNGPVNSENFNFEITASNDVRPDGEYSMSIKKENGLIHSETVKFAQDTDGTWRLDNVTLKDNESVSIIGLPIGEYKVTETTTEPGMETSVEVNNKGRQPTNSAVVELKNNGDQKIADYLNETDIGNINVGKKVTNMYEPEADKKFNFTMTLSDINEELIKDRNFDMIGADGKSKMMQFDLNNVTGNYEYKFSLAHNENIEIQGLPKDTAVTVEEESEDKFSTSYTVDGKNAGNPATATIGRNETIHVLANNERDDYGKLSVAKKAAGNLDTDSTFKFFIDSDGAIKNESRDAILSDGTNTHEKEVSFNGSGIAEFDLKPGQTMTIEGLPLGEYQVSEQAEDGITTNWNSVSAGGTADSGVSTDANPVEVAKNKLSSVEFTNRPLENDLIVSKEVLNMKDGDANISFKFKLTVVEGSNLIEGKTFNVEGLKNTEFSFEKMVTVMNTISNCLMETLHGLRVSQMALKLT